MRPLKIGLDYYSHDVKASNDRKLKLLIAKYGITGYGFFFRLCDLIYDENGYYFHWTEEDEILFCAEIQLEQDKCQHLLGYCLHLGLFDKILYEKYQILTSKRIQLNYLWGCQRRQEIEMIEEYLLIEPEFELKKKSKTTIKRVNVNINQVNVNENPVNVDISTYIDNNNNKDNNRDKDKDIISKSHSCEIISQVNNGNNQKSVVKKLPTPEGLSFAHHFSSLLPKTQKITDGMVNSWAETFDELVRIDGRDPPEIYKVTNWARTDEFWSRNFLSANKLRHKNRDGTYYFDVFLTHMKNHNGRNNLNRYKAPEELDYDSTL